jgi:hypothetical protein
MVGIQVNHYLFVAPGAVGALVRVFLLPEGVELAGVASGCSGGAGFFEIGAVFGGSGTYTAQLRYFGSATIEAEYALFQASDLPLRFDGLGDTLYLVNIFDSTAARNADEHRQSFTCAGTGGGGSAPLTLTAIATDETAAGGDGTITLLPDGGTPPLTVEVVDLGLNRPATAGTPELFSAIPASTYTVRATDAAGQVVTRTVTVRPYVSLKVGCQDEYADNYDATATSPGACTYTPLWRSAWGPTGVAVAVPALPGQVKAYTEAKLRTRCPATRWPPGIWCACPTTRRRDRGRRRRSKKSPTKIGGARTGYPY